MPTLTAALYEQPILAAAVVGFPVIVRERPRTICPDHSTYVSACAPCRTHQAAYKRWQTRQKAYGLFSEKVDPGPAREHLNKVLERHFLSPRQLEPLCGLSTSFLRKVAIGDVKQITRENEQKILALDADDALAEITVGVVSSRGASRRLRALAAIGWSSTALAEPTGCPDNMISRWRRRTAKTIGIENHRRIASTYHELHTVPGPCVDTAIKARQWEYAPPICWDDDRHLDNPQGRPRQFTTWLRLHPDPRTLAGAA